MTRRSLFLSIFGITALGRTVTFDDGSIHVTSLLDCGHGSLREAVDAINIGRAHRIVFDVGGDFYFDEDITLNKDIQMIGTGTHLDFRKAQGQFLAAIPGVTYNGRQPYLT